MNSCMVGNAVFWINALPVNRGMSSTIYPQTLIMGDTIVFKKHCNIEFGAYAEAHEKPFPQNSMQSRIEPAIYLRPTGNLQGSYWLLNLRNGRRIKRRTCTPLPVPTRVLDCIHALANTDNQNPAPGFLTSLVILSYMGTSHTTTMETMSEISREWRNTTTKWNPKEW